MQRIICVALVLLLSHAAGLLAAAEPPAGFAALFNGKDLAGWWGADNDKDPTTWALLPPEELSRKKAASLEAVRQHWRVENGELVNDGRGPFLTTDKYYGDFELFIEYKTVPKADSGIYLRGTPQVQIWDPDEPDPRGFGKAKGSGGLWNNSPGAPGKDPLVRADRPLGQWNKFHIIMLGERVSVWLNDKLVVDHARLENLYARRDPDPAQRNRPIPPAGPLELQTHGGEIRWRNIFIREIPGDEANKMLREKTPDHFKKVFNGKDLSGWTGDVESYEVTDGAIVCRPGKGGNLFTNEQYGDFVVRFEFKLPPGGNNGLAIRYPGEGLPSETGMCEIQVLDDQYEKATGQKIDPRQAHGSAYGMVAAARGHQRPVGQWNYQVVTVRGPTIQVELNGTRILDADLSKVTQFIPGHKHPGKDRTTGHFGFAGHNDPVMFRKIEIKKLD